MSIDRRIFLGGIAAAGITRLAVPAVVRGDSSPAGSTPVRHEHDGRTTERAAAPADRFDPWIDVDRSALEHNVDVVRRLTNGRPILAVIKNNAYGLGLVMTAHHLSRYPEVTGFAVVKPEDAIALRDAGVRGTILLMGMAPDEAVADLVAADVTLSLYLDDDRERLPARAGRRTGIPAHVYLDTGMSRMGIPYHRARPWLSDVRASGAFRLDGAFTAFTEEADFDREQLTRFTDVMRSADDGGTPIALHAASSNGVYHLPDAHLDMVRPGIALFGGYPSRPTEERALAPLLPAFALRCRVVRVERLRPGDSVSYGRSYVADRPTWIATLPAGHADGYPRGAVNGARVAIGTRTYPVIGAVSASHVIVEIGADATVAVGDVATLIGPDHLDVHPNELARVTDSSVYDLFMHLNPSLPRYYAP